MLRNGRVLTPRARLLPGMPQLRRQALARPAHHTLHSRAACLRAKGEQAEARPRRQRLHCSRQRAFHQLHSLLATAHIHLHGSGVGAVHGWWSRRCVRTRGGARQAQGHHRQRPRLALPVAPQLTSASTAGPAVSMATTSSMPSSGSAATCGAGERNKSSAPPNLGQHQASKGYVSSEGASCTRLLPLCVPHPPAGTARPGGRAPALAAPPAAPTPRHSSCRGRPGRGWQQAGQPACSRALEGGSGRDAAARLAAALSMVLHPCTAPPHRRRLAAVLKSLPQPHRAQAQPLLSTSHSALM